MTQGIGRYVICDVTDLTCCGRRPYACSGTTVSHLTSARWRVGVALQSILVTMPMNFVTRSTLSDGHHATNM